MRSLGNRRNHALRSGTGELPPAPPEQDSDGPPFLGTWRRVYIAVLLYLAVLIAGLALVTQAFTS
jgi:hypothetical protein